MKFLAILLILLSCAGLKMITPNKDYFSSEFIKKIDSIQMIYRDGSKLEALKKLQALKDEELRPEEKAKKYNFIGVIYYSNSSFANAIKSFKKANSIKHESILLKNQVRLNLASVFYKESKFEASNNYIKQIDPNVFADGEKNKFGKIQLALGGKFNSLSYVVDAAFLLGRDLKSFEEVKQFEYLSTLKSAFTKLSQSQRVGLLEQRSDKILAAYLAKDEAFRMAVTGDQSQIDSTLEWLSDNFGSFSEIQLLIANYKQNLFEYTKIKTKKIGIILPLSGDKRKYGVSTLRGIETALHGKNLSNSGLELIVKDSIGNSAIGSQSVKDLVLKEEVSIIIGGLFPEQAREQYLEAKKYGVLFISIAPINITREEKSPLLLEIPGSLQSQIYALRNSEFLKRFGNRVALLYPNDNEGRIYASELWGLHEEGLINITSLVSFDVGKNNDFRDPVGSLLGLQHKRERSEELAAWASVYKLEHRKSAVERKQFLRPIIDFDWVFLPVLPNKAIQILPTFKYYDAGKLSFFGIPSWSSQSLINEVEGLGDINFLGDNVKTYDLKFNQFFKQRNSRRARLLEILGVEAMQISNMLLSGKEYGSRGELASDLLARKQLKGITGQWSLVQNLWLKNMNYLDLTSSGIRPIKF